MEEEEEASLHGLKSYSSYLREEIGTAVQEALDAVVGDAEFQEHRVEMWINAILESCLGRFVGLEKNSKFVKTVRVAYKNAVCSATCVICPNDGTGMHGQSACAWHPGMDHALVYEWQNPYVRVCVTVFTICATRLR
ncbi:dynein light chain Tctex-type 1-like [Schistocerca nitens]|uniref:dynein light chain Tctex-type 1-like n=1 Tax=Schistocerca nitens TaxID=7011 RepID=UPI002119648F|nr:dynein light chain Tctex-type 1-like [Schistocerca nitens]